MQDCSYLNCPLMDCPLSKVQGSINDMYFRNGFIQWSVTNESGFPSRVEGAFNNYVDIILTFFDYTTGYSF